MAKSSTKRSTPQVEPARQRHQHVDQICHLADTIESIADCASVLAALSVMSPVERDGLISGEGMANGFELHPDSLPTLLAHAVNLAREVKAEAVAWHHTAWMPPELKVVGGSNGR